MTNGVQSGEMSFDVTGTTRVWTGANSSDWNLGTNWGGGLVPATADSVTIRVMVKTAPLEQWAVARALRQRIKARFDHEGIEIPFAQRVIWHRDERRAPEGDPAPAASGGEG